MTWLFVSCRGRDCTSRYGHPETGLCARCEKAKATADAVGDGPLQEEEAEVRHA